MTEPSDELLRQWLLHRLSPQEAPMLEERLLNDDEFGARLRAVETDLLDDFTHDRLGDADRDAVSTHLLATPDDRARLRIATALAHVGASARSPRVGHAERHAATPPHARWSSHPRRTVVGTLLASACAAALIAVVGLSHRDGAETPAATSVPGTVATITLLADQQRGAQIEDIGIPRAASTIRLQVEVDSAAPRQRYALSVLDGAQTIFSARDLAPREAAPYHFVEVTLAAHTLVSGEHLVRVAAQGARTGETSWSIRTRSE